MRGLTGLVALLLLGTGLLAGCGSTSMKRLGDPSGAHCPTRTAESAGSSFPQERLSAHVGVAAGTFRRWVWRPYRHGRLDIGAEHRSAAVAKATASAHAAALEYRAAAKDVSGDPTRCELMYSPLTDLANALDRLGRTLHSDDQASIDRSLTGLHEAVVELRTLVRSTGPQATGPVHAGPGRPSGGSRTAAPG